MHRRTLLHRLLAGSALPFIAFQTANASPEPPPPGDRDRRYWVDMLTRMARPVLEHQAAGTLRANMPVEFGPGGNRRDRQHYTYLEAVGRLLAGMAPWLEADGGSSAEQARRRQFQDLARQAISEGVAPSSPDYLNFSRHGAQPLVDAAFLAHAFLRAPGQLWHALPAQTQQRVVRELLSSRQIQPYYNNWLLFSATIEAFLLSIGEAWDPMRVDYAVRKHQEWYLGDGLYGDGPQFHGDYYNSFVIHPMLLDVLKALQAHDQRGGQGFDQALLRAKRYAAIQERLISPEGTLPVIGRSITYRFGALQLLGQMALWDSLPEEVSPAQVRAAMTAVLRKLMEAPGTFDENGWLQLGFCGHQPKLGESYISTGSLYLCATGFLPLGLPTEHAFWQEEAQPWTSQQVYAGQNLPRDHALYE